MKHLNIWALEITRWFLCIILIVLISSFAGKKNAERHFKKGNQKLAAKDYHSAIVEYTKAIRLKHNYAEAYYNRGVAKTWVNDLDGAMDDFEFAIKYNKTYYSEARKKSNTDKNIYWSTNKTTKLIRLPILSPNH